MTEKSTRPLTPRPLTPREAAKALGVSLPTLRRYAQAWEKEHGPLPRTPTGDRLWPREVVEAIAEARARGEIGRLTRVKLEEDRPDEADKGPGGEITLEKVEEALDLSPRVRELEARVRHLGHLEELNLGLRLNNLEAQSRLLAKGLSEVEREVQGIVNKNLNWRLLKVEEEIQSLGQSLGKVDQRLGKAEKEISEVKRELGEVKKELEARLHHLAHQIADLRERMGELEEVIEARLRRPWWRFW